MALPRGATPVDFAYAVHTDIGNRCVAAKINYELVPLRTELKNGDRVEIITAPHAHPNPAWLVYVKTGKARSQIRHFLKTMQYEESARAGRTPARPGAARARRRARRDRRASAGTSCCASRRASRARKCSPTSAWASASRPIVARKLLALRRRQHAGGAASSRGSIVIRGSEGMAVQFAQAAAGRFPGDPIIGFIKKGQGLVVHTHDCPTAAQVAHRSGKWIDVEWAPGAPSACSTSASAWWSREPARRAREGRRGDRRRRLQHRQCQHGRGARRSTPTCISPSRCRIDCTLAKSDAQPAAHPGSRTHCACQGLTSGSARGYGATPRESALPASRIDRLHPHQEGRTSNARQDQRHRDQLHRSRARARGS